MSPAKNSWRDAELPRLTAEGHNANGLVVGAFRSQAGGRAN